MIDTINTVCKDIAPALGLPEPMVRKVYAHYWKTVRQSVASGQYTSVWLRSIGTLVISRTKVNKYIKKLINRIRFIRADKATYTRKTKEQMMHEALTDLSRMCARRNDIAKAYKANLDRLNAKHAAKTKGHMGVQAPDTSGGCEPPVLP